MAVNVENYDINSPEGVFISHKDLNGVIDIVLPSFIFEAKINEEYRNRYAIPLKVPYREHEKTTQTIAILEFEYDKPMTDAEMAETNDRCWVWTFHPTDETIAQYPQLRRRRLKVYES